MKTNQEFSPNPQKLFPELTALRTFNQALVYEFEPEESCFAQVNNPNNVEYFTHSVSQQLDILEAYLYIQNDLLPQIEKISLNNLTKELLLEWINQIHLRITATLAKDYADANIPGAFAGQYSNRQLRRWHLGIKFSGDLSIYLSDLKNVTLQELATKYKIELHSLKEFVSLLERIHRDNSINLPDYEKIESNPHSVHATGVIIFGKLAVYYHSQQITEKEKKLINQFVKICIPPTDFVTAMTQYAEKLLKNWQTCDAKNTNQVAELAATLFYDLTNIHPFFNGNGRLATAVMNLVFHSLGLSSILMRSSNEKEDPESSYAQAIAHMDTNLKLLIAHIKNRIEETKTKGPYENKNNKEIFLKQYAVAKVVTEIQTQFPQYEINSSYQRLTRNFTMLALWKGISQHEMQLKGLEFYISSFEELYSELLKEKQQKVVLPTPIQKKFSEAEKKTVIEKIESLTHRSSWNAYNTKNGLIVLLNVEKEEDGKQIIEILNQTGALEAKAMRHAQTKQAVVQVSNIRLDKLLALNTSSISTKKTGLFLGK